MGMSVGDCLDSMMAEEEEPSSLWVAPFPQLLACVAVGLVIGVDTHVM